MTADVMVHVACPGVDDLLACAGPSVCVTGTGPVVGALAATR